jgi:hypothetical protein
MGSHAPVLYQISAPTTEALTNTIANFNLGDIGFVAEIVEYYQFSASSGAAVDGFNVLATNLGGATRWLRLPNYVDFLLDNDPVTVATTLAITRVGGLVTSLTWTDNATSKIVKTVDLARSGSLVSSSIVKIYATDGITVVAQTTSTNSYVGTLVASTITTRDL